MVKMEPVDDILMPHSPGSYYGHSSLFLSGMDPEIEEISQKDYHAGELLTLFDLNSDSIWFSFTQAQPQ
jgi:hypothetical protein